MRAPLQFIPERQYGIYLLICDRKSCCVKIEFPGPGEGNPPQVLLPSSVLLVVATLQTLPPLPVARLPIARLPITKAQSKGLIGAKLPGMTKPGAERGKHTPAIPPCNFYTPRSAINVPVFFFFNQRQAFVGIPMINNVELYLSITGRCRNTSTFKQGPQISI